MRGEGREEKGGGEEAFLVMWPRRLSALNTPLCTPPPKGDVECKGV